MISLLSKLVSLALWIFELSLIVYVVLSFLKLPDNKWTELLNRFIEPVLSPLRAFLTRTLPARVQFWDWSPVAAWLLAELAGWMLNRLFSIFL